MKARFFVFFFYSFFSFPVSIFFFSGCYPLDRLKGLTEEAYLNAALCGDHSVHGALGEGIEAPISPPHEIRLQQIARGAVVLELALIQLHRQIRGLEVQRHHLAASVPEDLFRDDRSLRDFSPCSLWHISCFICFSLYLWHIIRRIGARALRIYSAHLPLIIIYEFDGRRFQVVQASRFREGRHIVMDILF